MRVRAGRRLRKLLPLLRRHQLRPRNPHLQRVGQAGAGAAGAAAHRRRIGRRLLMSRGGRTTTTPERRKPVGTSLQAAEVAVGRPRVRVRRPPQAASHRHFDRPRPRRVCRTLTWCGHSTSKSKGTSCTPAGAMRLRSASICPRSKCSLAAVAANRLQSLVLSHPHGRPPQWLQCFHAAGLTT